MELSGEGGDSGFSGGRGDPGRQPVCRCAAENGVAAAGNELTAGGGASQSERRNPYAKDEEREEKEKGDCDGKAKQDCAEGAGRAIAEAKRRHAPIVARSPYGMPPVGSSKICNCIPVYTSIRTRD